MKQVCEGTVRSQFRSNKKLFGEHSAEKNLENCLQAIASHNLDNNNYANFYARHFNPHLPTEAEIERGGGGEKHKNYE